MSNHRIAKPKLYPAYWAAVLEPWRNELFNHFLIMFLEKWGSWRDIGCTTHNWSHQGVNEANLHVQLISTVHEMGIYVNLSNDVKQSSLRHISDWVLIYFFWSSKATLDTSSILSSTIFLTRRLVATSAAAFMLSSLASLLLSRSSGLRLQQDFYLREELDYQSSCHRLTRHLVHWPFYSCHVQRLHSTMHSSQLLPRVLPW